jgi:hypothetical protein
VSTLVALHRRVELAAQDHLLVRATEYEVLDAPLLLNKDATAVGQGLEALVGLLSDASSSLVSSREILVCSNCLVWYISNTRLRHLLNDDDARQLAAESTVVTACAVPLLEENVKTVVVDDGGDASLMACAQSGSGRCDYLMLTRAEINQMSSSSPTPSTLTYAQRWVQ